MMRSIVGWDIGAANVKAAFLKIREGNAADQLRVHSIPFEIWREKERLPDILQSGMAFVCSGALPQEMAVTMTAELSDIFETKREGVLYVLKCLKSCFPNSTIQVFSTAGKFVPLDEAARYPLEFAATNWLATAKWFAGKYPDCLLIDVGSTTTDIVPVIGGKVVAAAYSDFERLFSGELVYTGLLRTNPAATVQTVPFRNGLCRVASELFTITADVHLVLGNISLQDYSCATPDRRPPSILSAQARLARLICGDIESLSAQEIEEIARHIQAQQVLQIRGGIEQVLSRVPELRRHPVIVLGTGAFLGMAAARSIGLEIRTSELARDESAVAPCVSVARLLAQRLKESRL